MKQIVKIEGMHCEMCSSRVCRVFGARADVESVEVDLEGKRAILTVSVPLDEKVVREVVEDLGFDFLGVE
ncbi:MAG: heavy-metal-associated domain-containing protein [Clostridia bacterium]|nr:heavy-metal-associated domain-containing protein [Clostridia bacterium]